MKSIMVGLTDDPTRSRHHGTLRSKPRHCVAMVVRFRKNFWAATVERAPIRRNGPPWCDERRISQSGRRAGPTVLMRREIVGGARKDIVDRRSPLVHR